MSELSLSQWLQDSVEHSMAASLSVLKEVADALDAAHGSSTLHGNLSPAQIRLRVGESSADPSAVSAQLIGFGKEAPVQSNLDIGTPPPEAAYYYAPEKILGSRATRQSDQFSLGVIAYELLCGVRPFDAPNLPALFHRICTKQPESQCESLEPAVHRILNRAIAKNPDERFASCTSFLEALQTALGEPARPTVAAAANARTERLAASGERFGAVGAGMAGAAVGSVRGAYLHRDESTADDLAYSDDEAAARTESATRFDDDFAPGSRRHRFVHNPIDEMADLTDDPRLAGPFRRNRSWLIPLLALAALAVAFVLFRPYLPWQKWQAAIVGNSDASESTSSTASPSVAGEPPSTAPASTNSQTAAAAQPDGGTATPTTLNPVAPPEPKRANEGNPTPPPSATQQATAAVDAAPPTAASSQSRTLKLERPPEDRPATTPYRAGVSSLPSYIPRTSRSRAELDPLALSTVELVTTPPGSRITVDSRPDIGCQAPCSLSLTSGRHTLTAEQDGFAIARRIFNVPEDRSLFIPLIKGIGTLALSSQPQGSVVTIDGKPAGTTPFTVRLTAGTHRVDMVKGTQHHQETLEIQSDALQTRAFAW